MSDDYFDKGFIWAVEIMYCFHLNSDDDNDYKSPDIFECQSKEESKNMLIEVYNFLIYNKYNSEEFDNDVVIIIKIMGNKYGKMNYPISFKKFENWLKITNTLQ